MIKTEIDRIDTYYEVYDENDKLINSFGLFEDALNFANNIHGYIKDYSVASVIISTGKKLEIPLSDTDLMAIKSEATKAASKCIKKSMD